MRATLKRMNRIVCLSIAFGIVATSIPAADLLVPRISGPWTVIARSPDLGPLGREKQEPVDFAVWQAADGSWQLWSCIRNTSEPGRTRLLHRWESSSLTAADWKPMGIAMQADPKLGETAGGLQAPYVFRDGEKFRLFYGDWVRICSATSADGKTFVRDVHEHGQPALFSEGPHDNARDPFVIRIGSQWHCYYTSHPKGKGAVYCRTSAELKTWSPSIIAAARGQAGDGPFSAECPHVVEASPGQFYLFRTQKYGRDAITRVYHSTDPLDFGRGDGHGDALHFITSLPVAAPETVHHEGRWFVVALGADLKSIQLAALEWQLPDAARPRSSATRKGAIRVALYDDSGSSGRGVPSVSRQLGAVPGVELVKLDGDDIREGLHGFDAVVFMGGSGGRQADTIGLLGREQIRHFVAQGGGYVGICAGAYLACDGFQWGVKVLDAKTPSSKWMRGRADLQIEATAAGRETFGYPTGQFPVRYHNGPLFVPAGNAAIPDYEPLALFRTEIAENDSPPGIMINTPAMVRGQFGKGRVLVSSPHPEQTAGLESFAGNALRWVTAKGDD